MKKYRLGERLSFTTWKKLLTKALALSCDGYGVAVIGFDGEPVTTDGQMTLRLEREKINHETL